MNHLYLVTKTTVENKKLVTKYLSHTGKWIKNKHHAGGMSKEMAEKAASENAATLCPFPMFCGTYR
jgi:ribosomal protein S17E